MSTVHVDALDEGQWRRPGKIYQLRRFLASDRHPVAKACGNCRKSKLKCDALKPCTRCKRKELRCDLCDEVPVETTGSSAVSAKSERVASELLLGSLEQTFRAHRDAILAAKLERPLPLSPLGICFDDNLVLREQRARQLPHRMLRIAWDSGFAEEMIINVFRHMTPALSSAIDTALSAVETLAFGATAPPPPPPEAAGVQNLQLCTPLQDSDRIGIFQCVMDPVTNRRMAANCNNCMSQLIGAPKEVSLAAVGRGDVKIATTELRFLCHILNDLAEFGKDQGVLYMRWSPGSLLGREQPPILVRCTKVMVRDELGRPSQVKIYHSAVSEQEYEAARKLNPQAVEPYVSEVPGVPTTAQELLSPSSTLREDESFAALNSSPQGRAKLDSLARIVLSKFGEIISKAEEVRAMSAASSRTASTASPPLLAPSATQSPSPNGVFAL